MTTTSRREPKMEAAPRKRTRKAMLLAEREGMLACTRSSLLNAKSTTMQDVETTQSILSFVSLWLIEWIYPERD